MGRESWSMRVLTKENEMAKCFKCALTMHLNLLGWLFKKTIATNWKIWLNTFLQHGDKLWCNILRVCLFEKISFKTVASFTARGGLLLACFILFIYLLLENPK